MVYPQFCYWSLEPSPQELLYLIMDEMAYGDNFFLVQRSLAISLWTHVANEIQHEGFMTAKGAEGSFVRVTSGHRQEDAKKKNVTPL